MAEEYVVELNVENTQDLDKVTKQLQEIQEQSQKLQISFLGLQSSLQSNSTITAKELVKLRDSTVQTSAATDKLAKSVSESTKALENSQKSIFTATNALKAVKIAASAAALSIGFYAATVSSNQVATRTFTKLQDLYQRTMQAAARGTARFVVQHKILGTVLAQTYITLTNSQVALSRLNTVFGPLLKGVTAVGVGFKNVTASVGTFATKVIGPLAGAFVKLGSSLEPALAPLKNLAVIIGTNLGDKLKPILTFAGTSFLKFKDTLVGAMGTASTHVGNFTKVVGGKFKTLFESISKLGIKGVLVKPFTMMTASFLILGGKMLGISKATKGLGSAFSSLGFTLSHTSRFTRMWSSTMSAVDKTLPGTSARLQNVSRGFGDIAKNIGVNTSAIPGLLDALGKLAMKYFLVYQAQITLAHVGEAVGEKMTRAGEAIIEQYSEAYMASAEMVRTQIDLNRAVIRYHELSKDTSMSTKDWVHWTDKLAVASGKNLVEMRRVTGSLLDFAALYGLNQKETKHFISLMTDVSTFLGKDVFDALQHVHGAMAGYTRSAQILGVNIDHLREKTKFYEDQLRKEGGEIGKSVHQKAQLLALISELNYLHGVNNHVMKTAYGITKQYAVSQELVAAQIGKNVAPVLNVYYKTLTKLNLLLASPGIANYVNSLKAVGGVTLSLTGMVVKFAAKLFILFETLSLIESAMTLLNKSFGVFQFVQGTALASLVRQEGNMLKLNLTTTALSKTFSALGASFKQNVISSFKEGIKAVKSITASLRTYIATLFTVRSLQPGIGETLSAFMAPSAGKGLMTQAKAFSTGLYTTLFASGLQVSKKVAPEVKKHAAQMLDLYKLSGKTSEGYKAWAETLTIFGGEMSRSSKVMTVFRGALSKISSIPVMSWIMKLGSFIGELVKKFGVWVTFIWGIVDAFTSAFLPAIQSVIGSNKEFAGVLSSIGQILKALLSVFTAASPIISKFITLIVHGFGFLVANSLAAVSIAIGLLLKGFGKLLTVVSYTSKILSHLPKSLGGDAFKAVSKATESLSDDLSTLGEGMVQIGIQTNKNAMNMIGYGNATGHLKQQMAQLRKELSKSLQTRQDELGLNLQVSKSYRTLMLAATDLGAAYEKFVKFQDKLKKGSDDEGKSIHELTALKREGADVTRELETARQKLVKQFEGVVKGTKSEISQTQALVGAYANYVKQSGDAVDAQRAISTTSASMTRIWSGLNKVAQGQAGGISEVADSYFKLSTHLKEMATKASPSLRAALLTTAKAYEVEGNNLNKLLKSSNDKVLVDDKLIAQAVKVALGVSSVNSTLKEQETLYKNLTSLSSGTSNSLKSLATTYSKDLNLSVEDSAALQLQLAQISEVGARKVQAAMSGQVGALDEYRNYLTVVQKTENDSLHTTIKTAEGRKLLNNILEQQKGFAASLSDQLKQEGAVSLSLIQKITAHTNAIKAHASVVKALIHLQTVRLNLWDSELALRTKLTSLTLQGQSTQEKANATHTRLVGLLQQSAVAFASTGRHLNAFDKYLNGTLEPADAARAIISSLSTNTDELSKTIRSKLLSALTSEITSMRTLQTTNAQVAKEIKNLENVIHPVHTAFGAFSRTVAELRTSSSELAKREGDTTLAFQDQSVTLQTVGSFLENLHSKVTQLHPGTSALAKEVLNLSSKLLNLTKVDATAWASSLTGVFSELEQKTRDTAKASDLIRPAILNSVFGFSSLHKQLTELDPSLAKVASNLKDNAAVMYTSLQGTDDYSASLGNLSTLENQIQDTLAQVLPSFNDQVKQLVSGGEATAEIKTKTSSYIGVLKGLLGVLSSVRDAREKTLSQLTAQATLQEGLIYSTDEARKAAQKLADVSLEKLQSQFPELTKKQLEVARTIALYGYNADMASKRVAEGNKYISQTLQEQIISWQQGEDAVNDFTQGLNILGASAAQGVIQSLSDVNQKVITMGGYMNAAGLMAKENFAKTAVDAIGKFNTAIVDSIAYGKKFQMSFKEVIQSFIAGMVQALLKLIELKLAMAAMKSFGFGLPFKSGGMVPGFATGGIVPGYGEGDKVPALLEPGEFVVPKPVVAKAGVEFFQNLTQMLKFSKTKEPRHFKEGGVVPVQKEDVQAQPQEQQPIQIVNVLNPDDMLDALSTTNGEQAVLNIISRRNSTVRRLLG